VVGPHNLLHPYYEPLVWFMIMLNRPFIWFHCAVKFGYYNMWIGKGEIFEIPRNHLVSCKMFRSRCSNRAVYSSSFIYRIASKVNLRELIIAAWRCPSMQDSSQHLDTTMILSIHTKIQTHTYTLKSLWIMNWYTTLWIEWLNELCCLFYSIHRSMKWVVVLLIHYRWWDDVLLNLYLSWLLPVYSILHKLKTADPNNEEEIMIVHELARCQNFGCQYHLCWIRFMLINFWVVMHLSSQKYMIASIMS